MNPRLIAAWFKGWAAARWAASRMALIAIAAAAHGANERAPGTQPGLDEPDRPALAVPAKPGPPQSWARLKFSSVPAEEWKVDPIGDLNLIEFIHRHTAVNFPSYWFAADVESLPEMVNFPFIFMHAQKAPQLTAEARANLREYLLRGGFLFAEDCVNPDQEGGKDAFFRKMAEEFPKIVPEATFAPLSNEHPVFHVLYEFADGLPRIQGVTPDLWALTLNGRILALLSPADLHCAWTYGDELAGPGTQKAAFQMGTNIYLFAMTQTRSAAPRPE